MQNDYIKIRGARVHNLKNIDLDFPKNKLIVIPGFRVRENHLWLLILYMQKDREDMLKVCQLTPGSFWE